MNNLLINNLNKYLLLSLCNYFDITFINIIFTNKIILNFYKLFFKKLYDQQIKFIRDNNFNNKIINLFGGIYKFALFPILKWSDEYYGFTGYIDNIKNKDITYKIMIGVDSYKRPFIVLRLKYYNKKSIICFFQRYTDNTYTWTHANIPYSSLITEGGYFFNKNEFNHELIEENINNLLTNKNIIKTNKFSMDGYNIVNEFCMLY